jgi:hypothetical protein
MSDVSVSVDRINKQGERGSPWRSPFSIVNRGDIWPLFKKQLCTLVYRIFTHLIKCPPKLKYFSILSILLSQKPFHSRLILK